MKTKGRLWWLLAKPSLTSLPASPVPPSLAEGREDLPPGRYPSLSHFPPKNGRQGGLAHRWALSSHDEWNRLFALESPLALSTVKGLPEI